MSARPEQLLREFKVDLTKERSFYVIYLDDEEDSLDVMSALFENMGLTCLATTSRDEALRWVGQYATDLVLIVSDYKMPGGDGFDFRQSVLEITTDVPFVIYSGFVDTAMALRGLELKISAFLDKPLDRERLYEIMAKDVSARVQSLRDDRELLTAFVGETEELTEQSEDLIMELDSTQDLDALNRFFGIVHTIKGASSFFEPKHLHRFAHSFEDILKEVQRGDRKLGPEMTSFFLAGMDVVKELLAEFKIGVFKERDPAELIRVALRLLETSERESEADAAAPTADVKSAAVPRQTEIKVATATLDEFMQLSGEMTVVRNMLNKSLRAIEKQYPGDREVANLSELLEELHKVNGSVQSKVIDLRKVSMRHVLKPLPRAVRDIAKQLGKQIELVLVGEQLRVDTSIAEVLANGLLHVVKNSVDHGIESTEGRVAAGKVGGGRITVTCGEKNEHVIIEVEDDGKGLNVDAIRNKLRANKSHSDAEIAHMPDRVLHAMIFEAGFSTAAQVTDISGRGVGMSMVKSLVQGAGGKIDIASRPGLGTKFTFSIPVPKSVLITNCLFVRVGQEQFGIMQDDISRSLHISSEHRAERLSRLEGGHCITIDGEIIPVVELGDVLGAPGQSTLADPARDLHVVIAGTSVAGQRTAVVVDAILDVEDTVIKTLPPQFNPHGLYRGATFLDDGTVGLILDTTNFISRAGGATRVIAAPDAAPAATTALEKSFLIFDLDIPGRYAVGQDLIFRIEEMDLSTAHRVGGVRVSPYRGGALSVLDLEHHLYPGARQTSATDESVLVVVMTSGEHFVGFPVRTIVDVVHTGALSTESVTPSRYLSGQGIWNDAIVNVINWPAITEVLLKASA